jgi:probable O-glycosylation ligase (exosortase A-associated)
MRDLLMLGAMCVIVPLSLANAFAAYLLWEWSAVLSPAYYLYGFMSSVRYNFMFALITIGLVALGRLSERGSMRVTGTVAAVVIFFLHACGSAAFAYEGNSINIEVFSGLAKSIIYCLFMPLIVTSRLRIHAMLIMLALGLGLHGVLEGAKVLVTAGGHRPIGIATSMMSDNNHFAVALVMMLPIFFYLFRYSERKLVRLGFLGVFTLTVVAVIGTQSRGAFVAMSLTGLWLILSSRRRVIALVTVACMAVVVAIAAPSTWYERMETIQDANKDDSFLGRVAAWRVSTAIALDNPLFGGGFHSVQVQYIWEARKVAATRFTFLPEVQEMPDNFKAAHSIYFEVLGDQGFLGLFLFLALFAVAFWNLWSIRRLNRRHGLGMTWAADLASMLGVSLLAYAVGGALVSLAYFESFYVFVLLTDVLRRVVTRQVEDAARPAADGAGRIHRRRRLGGAGTTEGLPGR